jgi:hypothetical protein
MSNDVGIATEAPSQLVHSIGPLPSCPACDGTDFLVKDGHGRPITFVCLGCRAAWRFGLGYVWRVDDLAQASLPETSPTVDDARPSTPAV